MELYERVLSHHLLAMRDEQSVTGERQVFYLLPRRCGLPGVLQVDEEIDGTLHISYERILHDHNPFHDTSSDYFLNDEDVRRIKDPLEAAGMRTSIKGYSGSPRGRVISLTDVREPSLDAVLEGIYKAELHVSVLPGGKQ